MRLLRGKRSDCQALAAPTPAVGDDPAPAHRAHALAEAVRLRPLTAIWLISTLHCTPLRALRNHSNGSTRVYPKPGNAIQQSRTQVRLRVRTHSLAPCSQKNAAKRRLAMRELVVLVTSASQGLKMLIIGRQASRMRGTISGVIHSLWITLWITMLIACKSGLCVRGL